MPDRRIIQNLELLIMIYSVLGEPVEKCDDVDYVPTVFAHSMKSKMVELKSAERQKRIDKRRKVVEAEEFAAIASANREDRRRAEFGAMPPPPPRYCTAYRRGNLSHSKPSPSLPC